MRAGKVLSEDSAEGLVAVSVQRGAVDEGHQTSGKAAQHGRSQGHAEHPQARIDRTGVESRTRRGAVGSPSGPGRRREKILAVPDTARAVVRADLFRSV